MPGLLKRSAQFCGGGCGGGCGGSDGIWSKHRGDITAAQLQKFWNALPYHARRELLKIDKQTLFEQARKNLYCSRCNGLLLEGFSQIIMYGKSLQLEDADTFAPDGTMQSEMQDEIEIDDTQDPSVHPWGGLATTRDGILTLLDCFINAKSLKALQNVFDNARARERERELLYPDACGGGGRGWISQGIASYGRGHGIRDTCALHTARLSCDTLVDFWSALSDDTRLSLLRMKEEDFIERLMYRFDSKRFCRDCRRNVIREFKELKELKRMRREPHCSSCFCVADTALQYEVLSDAVQVDWHRSFTDSFGTYHRFEWAIGTAEGKSDILNFEDVGTIGKVHVSGLDLGGFGACFITVRAWKLDGRCTELCVKAHALRGKPCVHRRLIVGDGYVTITKGDSIQRFFEHAEEAEEEEDDDAMDKDGNEYDDGSRPQKHAKSPELAREFLLDAASVIFKEQVEKAFREGTARQNAHSVFVCLALKLLEERIHVACKEIITLEKQIRLLEEEEKEKREEEERKERRRTKEREKKLRRKERLKGKERERERKDTDSNSPNLSNLSMPTSNNDLPTSPHDEPTTPLNNEDSISDPGGIHGTCDLVSPETTNQLPVDGCVDSNDPKNGSMWNQLPVDGCVDSNDPKNGSMWHECHVHEETNSRDGNDSFALEQAKSARRKLRDQNDCFVDQPSKWFINGAHRPTRERVLRNNSRNCNPNSYEKVYGSNGRTCDRHNFGPCTCNQQDHRMKDEYHIREAQATNNSEFLPDAPRPQYHSMKYNRGCYAPAPDGCAAPKGKLVPVRDGIHTKQVWEPIDARKKWARSISDPDITWRTVSTTGSFKEVGIDKNEHQCGTSNPKPLSSHQAPPEDCIKRSNKSDTETVIGNRNGFVLIPKSDCYSAEEDAKSCPSMPTQNARDSSSSDNCSCISELDSGASLTPQNAGSLSPSDSEDTSPQSAVSTCQGSAFRTFPVDDTESQPKDARIGTGVPVSSCTGASAVSSCHDRFGCDMAALQQQHIVPIYNQSMHGPFYPSLPIGYHNQTAPSWLAAPTNGFVPYAAAAQHNPYMFPSPFGYGQPPDFQLQYNTVQLLAPPMLNLAQHPMYQPNNGVYVGCPEEQIKHRTILVAQENTDAPGKVHPLKTKPPPPVVAQKGDAGNVAKASGETPSFSLFHFGGPVAAAVSVSMKEEAAAAAAASVQSLPRSTSNLSCSTEDTKVEEYSLFSGRAMLDFHSACDFIK